MILIVAIVLLALRVIATAFLTRVLITQWELMRRPIDKRITDLVEAEDIIKYRKELFYLTLALAGSNLLPIVFDLYLISDEFGLAWFNITTFQFLVVYTLSNALAAVLGAFLINKIYRNALEVDTSHPDSDHTLMNNE